MVAYLQRSVPSFFRFARDRRKTGSTLNFFPELNSISIFGVRVPFQGHSVLPGSTLTVDVYNFLSVEIAASRKRCRSDKFQCSRRSFLSDENGRRIKVIWENNSRTNVRTVPLLNLHSVIRDGLPANLYFSTFHCCGSRSILFGKNMLGFLHTVQEHFIENIIFIKSFALPLPLWKWRFPWSDLKVKVAWAPATAIPPITIIIQLVDCSEPIFHVPIHLGRRVHDVSFEVCWLGRHCTCGLHTHLWICQSCPWSQGSSLCFLVTALLM